MLLTAIGWAAPPSALAAATEDEVATAAPGSFTARQAEAHYHFALAKLHADAGDFDDALAAFEKALELDPSDAYGFLETAKFYGYLAQVSRTRQQTVTYLDKSLELLAAAREMSPENPDILRLFAETHLRLGEQRPASYAIAQGALEKLRELDGSDLRTLVSLGQIYLFSRQPEKAAEVLAEASRYSPRNRMVLSMLADALLASKRGPEAEQALAELIPLDPSNVEHSLKLANLLSERGEHAGAVAVLEAAGEGDWLTTSRVRQTLAREYHLIGEQDKALALVEKMLEDPFAASAPNRGLQRLKASILTAMTRYGDAIDAFRPALDGETDPERRLQDVVLLSRLYERRGAFDEAVELLRREASGLAEQVSPTRLAVTIAEVQKRGGDRLGAESTLRRALEGLDGPMGLEAVDLTRELAVLLSADDRPAAAAELLEKALAELGPAETEERARLAAALQLNLAGVYAELERWSQMEAVGTALTASENPDIAFVGVQVRADALAEQGQLAAALAAVEGSGGPDRQVTAKRVELMYYHGEPGQAEATARAAAGPGPQPASAEDRLFAARLLQRHDLYGPSIELLEGLLEERPDDAVLFALGAAYERTGATRKAVATFERLLEASPDHLPSLNYLGYMWAERGENLERAEEMILRAVAADPDNGAYVDSLGWVYFQLGRYQEARPHLEWAARLAPDDPTVHEHLGDLYRELGDIAKARSAYRRSIELRREAAVATGRDAAEEAAEVSAKLESLEELKPGQATSGDTASGEATPSPQPGTIR